MLRTGGRHWHQKIAHLAWVLAVLCLTMGTLAAEARAVEVVVITNREAPVDPLTKVQLRNIYLGEITFWGNTRLTPVTYQHETPLQISFFQQVVGISANAFKTYWIKRIFREGGIPPQRVNSVDEAIRLVGDTPGAVGYVPVGAAADHPKVREVLRIPDN
ncbi:MAG: hypothetical protein OEW11_01565 [Nitrospirota bacterium]|nr:hypothetical protein [Nitrospirota bacterium]